MKTNVNISKAKPHNDSSRKTGQRRRPNVISDKFIRDVTKRLDSGKRVRRALPVWGRLHIDRQLPFLCVYRQTQDQPDPEAAELVVGQASYLLAGGEKRLHKGLSRLVESIASVLKEAFGSFILLEVWVGSSAAANGSQEAKQPTFRIHLPKETRLGLTVSAFQQALQDIQIQDEKSDVTIVNVTKPCPSRFPSLLTPSRAASMGCHVMGIEVNPVYHDPAKDLMYPMVHKMLRRRLAAAYKKGFFDFTRRHTTHRPPHFHALGPRAMIKAVWTVDEQLANVSSSFDLLLSVTPVNSEAAWRQFRKDHFERMPEFVYRPLPMDPSLLKRQLYRTPIERIEDPTLAHLFSQQQLELDRRINLLIERNSPQFIHSSQQLYGSIDDSLLTTAREILESSPSRERDGKGSGTIDARTFAVRAKEEIDYLNLTHPVIQSQIQVRDDVVGLMVSYGNLLIGNNVKVPVHRVPAAIAHEVGTHIITYFNARAQPFRQLSAGLPGYEELQEGLAVFSEYLVGALNMSRLRLLAARVVAAKHMVEGASFIEVFRELERTHRFSQKMAYSITMRLFRGGGFTKDVLYLKGMLSLEKYLHKGGTLNPLYSGKFALRHLPIIRELQMRRVLGPPLLQPPYLDDPGALKRIEMVRSGSKLIDLVRKKKL
jgi:uncharacterized protein (TIGR02421 family)